MSAENVEGSRESVVKRWLAKHPKRAKTIRLTVTGDDGSSDDVLLDASVDEMPPGAHVQLIEAVDSCVEARAADVVARLQWRDASGVAVQTRLIRRVYRGDTSPVPMSGSVADQAAMAQRHMHAMTRLYHDSMSAANQQLLNLAQTALSMMEKVTEHLTRRTDEADELRAALLEVQMQRAEEIAAERQEEEKQDSTLDKAVGILTPLLANGAAPRPREKRPEGGEKAAD